jgi:hypothetical protein
VVPTIDIKMGLYKGWEAKGKGSPYVDVTVPVGVGSKLVVGINSYFPEDKVRVNMPYLGMEAKRLRYLGKVLENREMNGYHDSDFYVNVWDEANGCIKKVSIGSTRGPQGPENHYWWTVDATPDVVAKAQAYLELEAKKARIRSFLSRKLPAKGEVVTVVAGRKVPKGTTGEVFWVGPNGYGKNEYRVGFKSTEGDKFFIAAGNLSFTINPAVLWSDEYGYERALVEKIVTEAKAEIRAHGHVIDAPYSSRVYKAPKVLIKA